ncbi:DsbA family protein [Kordiimonas sp. SCSIO 12603]|uniref:DsbA family protein n=1 Tax=Kordiimonas sp. SCSIO 12603 TaxID=2829596 RepID=UPI0021033493|nr:DsbA family protein [Kordiimonas sp. SCSIO 12603]UTW57315.1 DsbA family protein [Kordiimonas sp. SCSIO 12603]
MYKPLKNMLAAVTLAVPAIFGATAQEAAPTDRQAIESIIQEYLLENPEVIERAIIELQRRRQLAQMLPAINLYRGYLENDPEAPVLGNPNGDVTIVEFFDYRCGFCRRHFPEVLKLVKEDGNIRYIPRQYPVLDREGDTPVSLLTSYAALAAHKQGKFEEFHIAAMTSPGQLTEERIYEIAGSVGLNVDQLKTDMKDKLVEKSVRNTLSIGQDIGFTGTPGYIIGDDVVLGAEGYFRLLEAVDRARKDTSKETASSR